MVRSVAHPQLDFFFFHREFSIVRSSGSMSSALVALVIGWSPTRSYAPAVTPRAVVRAQPIQLMLQPPKMPWEARPAAVRFR